jgi:preprotein translocase subunit SecE
MIKKIKRFPQFLREVKGELKKVSWSTREELVSATFVVIIASIFLTVYIASIDLILSNIVKYFLK